MAIDPARRLEELFSAEREVRRAQADLAATPPAQLLSLLRSVVTAARGDADRADGALRMDRAAAVDLLVDVLACEEPEPRLAAGEALEERAFSRFKEVALGIERALER